MKRKISCFIVILSLATLIPSVGAADSCVPANGKQDSYSAKLAKKGLKREKKAMKILAQFEKQSEDAAERAAKASSADPESKLDKIKLGASALPVEALKNAKCAVVIPGDKEIGYIFGADYGAGISVCRDGNGNWGKPSFVKIRGASFGWQVGAKSTDQVLLFMKPDSEQILQKPSVELGGDAAAAAWKYGRDATADGELNLNKADEVLSYSSHSGGGYIGATLDGAVLQPDTKMTAAVAGQKVKEGFFEKIGQDIAGVFEHPKNDCDASISAAGAASDVNAAVNPPANAPQAAVASNAQIEAQAEAQLAPAVAAQAPAPEAPAQQAPAAQAPAAQAGAVN